MNINDYIERIQLQVRRVHGLGHDEVAACAAVHAWAVVVTELEEDYRDRFAAYAERLRVTIGLLNTDHRNSGVIGPRMLDGLLSDLRKEAGE